MSAHEVVFWLFVIDLGVASGAGLYEARVVVPQWFPVTPAGLRIDQEAMRRLDTGRRFWGFVTTVPLTLLCILTLILAWPLDTSMREAWLTAAGLTVVDRLGTFAFFIPTVLKLIRTTPITESELRIARRWKALNWGRVGLNFAAWLVALRAAGLHP